jgi:hypothetical protein
MGQHCPVRPLKVKRVISPLPQSTYTTASLTDVTQVSETSSAGCQSSKQSQRQQL